MVNHLYRAESEIVIETAHLSCELENSLQNLTKSEEIRLQSLFLSSEHGKFAEDNILVNIDLSVEQFLSLKDFNKLNSGVINLYGELLTQEDPRNKNLFLSTEFYNHLTNAPHGSLNYDLARLLIGNCNIFLKEKLFIPVYSSKNHWTLIMVNMTHCTVRYYDTLYSDRDGEQITWNVLSFISREAEIQKCLNFKISDWCEFEGGCGVPQQQNEADCGVFVIMFMDFLSRNLSVTPLHQRYMSLFRKKISLAILKGSIGKRGRDEEVISDILLSFKRPCHW
jgi:sentrin-specific protease 1